MYSIRILNNPQQSRVAIASLKCTYIIEGNLVINIRSGYLTFSGRPWENTTGKRIDIIISKLTWEDIGH